MYYSVQLLYTKLSEALKSERPGENWDANKLTQWEQDVRAIATACNFDRHMFMTACGGRFERLH